VITSLEFGEPAIDNQFRSEHVARHVAGEEQHCPGNFVVVSKAPNRNHGARDCEVVTKLSFGLSGMFGLTHSPKVRASPIWKHSSARLLNDTRVRGVQAHHCQYYANPQSGRPAPKSIDCCLSGLSLYRFFPKVLDALKIPKPETVLR